MTTNRIVFFTTLIFFAISSTAQRVIRYDLYVGDTAVNYSGKTIKALAINGSIPAPTLTFTEGDTAEIYVHNTLKEETSIHWHGLIVPNQYDGVPYLTTAPIQPGETHLFRFPLVQNGTYWYHSHTKLQEQRGMYGALIIHKRISETIPEYTVLLSDWTDMKPYEVHRYLHNANDWFAIQKGSTQSYLEAIQEHQFKAKITNEWKRMLAMDVSDVYYDKCLTNGREFDEQPQVKAGQKIRLRIINGSASTYFWLKYAGGKITVVANDGMDVQPVEVDRMIIAVAETYDVVVTVPASGSFEFLSTAEDRTKSTSLWLGKGEKHAAGAMPKLKYFEGMQMMNSMMKLNGKMDDMGMKMSNQKMDMNSVMYRESTGPSELELWRQKKKKKKADIAAIKLKDGYNPDLVTLNYSMLKSVTPSTLPDAPTRTMRFELTGNMNRYVWSIDGKTVSERDRILIKHGENIRMVLYNGSMMRHPMHLHGHFFRVLNGQVDYAPLKNVLDIMPMETDTIEFAATESGDWFFHCHILYHMMSGMGRIFTYENSPPNPELPNAKKAQRKLFADDRMFHPMFRTDLATNGVDGESMLANTRWKFQTEWRLGYEMHHGWETESHLGRYFGRNQLIFPYIGWDFRYRKHGINEVEKNIFQQSNTKDLRNAFCIGLQYTLPLLIIADLRFSSDLRPRLQLMREDIPLTKRLRMDFMVNTDLEYMVALRVIASRHFAIRMHYDSDMGLGAGLTFSY